MEKDIKDLTKADLTQTDCVRAVLETYQGESRQSALQELMEVATRYRVATKVNKEIAKIRKEESLENNNLLSMLDTDSQGGIAATIENYSVIMREDEMVKKLFYYDSFSQKAIRCDSKILKSWDDKDDSYLLAYIEKKYNLYDKNKYYIAFDNTCNDRANNPIKNLIEKEPWDGTPRIDKFICDILNTEDSDYHREVSRMIFYGGISRLYHPGCKFDYMPILIGKQGTMKSTIVKWLALDEKYYTDISSIEGKDGMEVLEGHWVCEMAELLAMVRTKDVEAMKSYITRTVDKFRQSYGRRVTEHARSCIFIGTTNDYQFLSDSSGNRRYLPIKVGLDVGELVEHTDYVKNYILQCWREALELYRQKKIYLTIPAKYYEDVLSQQQSVLEDDPTIGLILEYLSKKNIGDKVCSIGIYTEALNGIKKKFDRKQSKDIARVMNNRPDWESHMNSTYRFDDLGTQRYWEKIVPKDKKQKTSKISEKIKKENEERFGDLD